MLRVICYLEKAANIADDTEEIPLIKGVKKLPFG